MNAIDITTTSPLQTIALGRALAQELLPGDLVFLEGQLGAGKTRLVKGIAHGLGIDPESVSSPTFVIAHEHPIPPASSSAEMLVHIDAYRVQSLEDLESIGWTRDSARPHSEFRKNVITVIEWPSRMKTPADTTRLQIDITHLNQESRLIRITPVNFPPSRVHALTRVAAKINHE